MNYAEQQRRMIEANRREEERLQLQKSEKGRNIHHSVNAIKREVAEEESELRRYCLAFPHVVKYNCFRLSELERETTSLKIKNTNKEEELAGLTGKLHEQQAQLRIAANRTDSLRKQLEDMHRRHKSANAAALVEHRRMQQETATSVRFTLVFLRNTPFVGIEPITRPCPYYQRRRPSPSLRRAFQYRRF